MSALRTTYQCSKGQNAWMQHQVVEAFSVHTPVASAWLLEKQCHPAAVRPRNRMLATPATSGNRTTLLFHTDHQRGYLKQRLHHADAQTSLAMAPQDKRTTKSTSLQEAIAGLAPAKAQQASTRQNAQMQHQVIEPFSVHST